MRKVLVKGLLLDYISESDIKEIADKLVDKMIKFRILRIVTGC